MRHERFTASPFDEVALTMGDRSQLEALAQTFVSDNLRQYLAHSAMGLDKVDARRWKVVKAKEALRVYSERSQRDMARRTRKHATETRTEEEESGDYLVSELPVMFSAGTLVGDLEEVMFGVVNPSLELMRIKSSAAKAARDQLLGPSTCSVFATCSMSETSSNLSASSTALSRSRCPKTTV
ncbi:hypothetical protein PRNP1_014469 [Phytophthora ramorum]